MLIEIQHYSSSYLLLQVPRNLLGKYDNSEPEKESYIEENLMKILQDKMNIFRDRLSTNT